MKKIIFSTTIITLLFISSINAQKGFRIEAGIGPTLGDSSEYFSYAILGNFYYLWNVSENISIGPTTGVLVFLGEGKNINVLSAYFVQFLMYISLLPLLVELILQNCFHLVQILDMD